VDGIYYLDGIDNTATVTFDMYGSSKYKGDIVIPEKITHTYYTEFGNEVTETRNVVGISDAAFADCTELTSLALPKTITSIGASAFSGCSSLSTINLPETVSQIGEYAFYGCSNMLTAVIGKNVSEIKYNAFEGCRLAKLILLPSSINIYYNAFTNEGERMTYVSNSSFDNVANIGTVNICNINSLFTIDNVCYIPVSAKERTCAIIDFGNFDIPSDINISDKITYQGIELTPIAINTNAFYCCNYVQSIKIANSIIDIGNYAFYNCNNLRTAVLPENLKNMGTNLFKDCALLESISIPNNISTVPDSSFENDTSLKMVTLGSNIQVIGENAFGKCNNIIELKCLSAKPASCYSGAIDDINKFTCKLLVPEGSKLTYESANHFGDFFIIEEYKVTGIDQNIVEEDYPIAEYNINGIKSSEEPRLKIVKMKSGKVIKYIKNNSK